VRISGEKKIRQKRDSDEIDVEREGRGM